jgi:MGT family glycosyltransferase
MSKIVFYSTPAHGHINPTLPLISELIKRGEKVVYYSTKLFKDMVTSTGAEYREYVHLQNFDTIAAGKNLALLYFMVAQATKEMLPTLISEIKEIDPDYIIHDALCMWGRHISSITKKPAINSITTFAYSNKNQNIRNTLFFIKKVGLRGILLMIKAYSTQKELCKLNGTTPLHFIDSMMNEEPLNIVYNSREFQPHQEYYNQQYQFVGPSIAVRSKDPDTTDYAALKRPLIYISMGTIWTGSYDIRVLIKALEEFKCTLVFSCSENIDIGQTENVYVRNHVNQLEVLKHADLFITHGGMNSVNEGLFNHVPLCIYPFQAEQDEVAYRVVELGCGEILENMSEAEIKIKVRKILRNKEYTDNCIYIANSFKDSGGYKKASDIILNYIKGLDSSSKRSSD